MAGQEHGPPEFPNLNLKLAGPKKLSAFEKEKQAAEAKRRAEEEATAAELKKFEAAFGAADDDDDSELGEGPRQRDAFRGRQSSGGEMPPRPKGMRALDEMRAAEQARMGRSAPNPRPSFPPAVRSSSSHRDKVDDDEDGDGSGDRTEPSRPTLELSSLPPVFNEADIEGLLAERLAVHSVQLSPPSDPDERTSSAIVTLEAEASKSEVDSAITALQSKYLGCGYYLKLSRHLPSTVTSMPTVSLSSISASPYGAETTHASGNNESLRNAPPPNELRHFGPPGSYTQGETPPTRQAAQALVKVRPPQDISLVRSIHMLVERLLSDPDPAHAMEVEALLMAQPKVQQDERFAFLYDPDSQAGAYYRYLLWAPYEEDATTGRVQKEQLQVARRLDDGYVVDWSSPRAEIPFPDLKCLEDVITHEDYVSSDEEEEDEVHAGEVAVQADLEQRQHLKPLQQARLVHLLARIPQSTTHLRTGDVARVTHFAIRHAGHAAEEIADWLLINLMKPLSTTSAAQYEKQYISDSSDSMTDSEEERGPRNDARKEVDPSAARINGLYIISDVLYNASRAAGAKNTWKYPQLFEEGFRSRDIFSRLAAVPKELSLGRMKTEQWKQRIGKVFEAWEAWNAYKHDVVEEFRREFLEPEPGLDHREAAADGAAAQFQNVDAKESSPAKPEYEEEDEDMDDMSDMSDHSGSIGGHSVDDDVRAVLADGDLGDLRRDGVDYEAHENFEGQKVEVRIVDQEMGENVQGPQGVDNDREQEMGEGNVDHQRPEETSFEATDPSGSSPAAQRPNRRVRAEDLL